MRKGVVGFVGLGAMGKGMATNLLRKGFELKVYDVNSKVMEEMTSIGASRAESLASLSSSCRNIIFCLPDTHVLHKAMFGTSLKNITSSPTTSTSKPPSNDAPDNPDCITTNLKEGDILIDCGTTHPLWTQQTHKRLLEKKIGFIDAPVSGLAARAEAGTLSIMVGGEEEIYEQVKPLLSAMGDKVTLMGKTGSGQLAKMANNVLFNVSIAAMAEMLPLAKRLGVDPERLARAVSAGSGQSFGFDFFAPLVLKRDFGPGYPLQSAYKDMQVIREMADSQEIELPPIISGTMWTYEEALKQGHGQENKGAMIKVWEKMLNVLVGEKQNAK